MPERNNRQTIYGADLLPRSLRSGGRRRLRPNGGRRACPIHCNAVVPCARILFFPQPSVSALIRDPRIAENYIRYLCGRIHFLSGKIDSLIAGTGERKVAQYLLSQLEGGAEMLRLSCSLTDLAERLHMGRASLYRAFDHLSSEGILEKRGRTIQVLDLEKLQLV